MTTPNTTPSTVTHRPGGSISVAFGHTPDPDDLHGSMPSNHSSGRVTVSNGKTSTESFQQGSVNHSDVVAERVANAESILGTARTKWGSIGQPLNGDTVVTVGGMDMNLATAAQLGYVSRNADGNFIETGVTVESQLDDQQRQQEEQAQQQMEDSFEFPEEQLNLINQLIEPLPQSTYDATVASAILNGSESLNYDELADALGTSKSDAMQRAQFIESSYRNQANAAIESIVSGDQDGFYEWAALNTPEDHQKALRSLVMSGSTADLKSLAKSYMRNTVPSDEALIAGGFEIKMEGGVDMVKVEGTWMTQVAAAKAGFI